MALVARDIPITRADVQGWIDTCPEGTPIEEWIETQVGALDLPDSIVNTSGHESLDDETSIVKMILSDLESYRAH